MKNEVCIVFILLFNQISSNTIHTTNVHSNNSSLKNIKEHSTAIERSTTENASKFSILRSNENNRTTETYIQSTKVYSTSTDLNTAITNEYTSTTSTELNTPRTNDDNPSTELTTPRTKDDNPSTESNKPSTNDDNPSTELNTSSSNDDDPPTELNTPSTNDDNPSTELNTPNTNDDNPSTKSNYPSTNDETPSTKLNTPSTNNDKPSTKLVTPSTNDENPSIELNTPSINANNPSTELNTPSSKHDNPSNKLNTPRTNVNTISFELNNSGTNKYTTSTEIVVPSTDEYAITASSTPITNKYITTTESSTAITNEYNASTDHELNTPSNNGTIEDNIAKRQEGLNQKDEIDFKKYNKYPAIENFLQSLENDSQIGPSGIGEIKSEIEVIGTTVEGKNISMIKIYKNDSMEKKSILIDGGIHAREWISPAVVVYIINQLKNNPKKLEVIEDMVDNYDWYIIPLLNPDGYVYSYTKKDNWRKNRRKTSNKPDFGIDLNRNFGYKWNHSIGGSKEKDSDIYAGEHAFTERESKALKKVMDRNGKSENIIAYFTFHSFSQIICYPWGYTNKTILKDKGKLEAAGAAIAKGIKDTHTKTYRVGQCSFFEEFGEIAGASDDYAKGNAKIKYAYTVELRDTGTKGFFLPASEIIPNSEEILAGMIAFVKHLKNN